MKLSNLWVPFIVLLVVAATYMLHRQSGPTVPSYQPTEPDEITGQPIYGLPASHLIYNYNAGVSPVLSNTLYPAPLK